MSKNQGAFYDAVKYVVEKDMDLKKLLLEDMINNYDKYPPIAGEEMFKLIFGDYQAFADKFKRLK